MPFGQLVIGPPGSGKTTYCEAMRRFLSARGRTVAVVNLDPANDARPYPCAVDVCELISADDAADEHGLGPNGAMVYCLDYLAANRDWLAERLQPLGDAFLIFDCPGQIELYTHHETVRNLVHALGDSHSLRLVAVHLLDAHHCAEVSKYVSGLVVSLSAMMQLELPHVNVLSKVDLLEAAGPLALPLSFYTDVQQLHRLLPLCEGSSAFGSRHTALTARLCELVEDVGLLHFIPVAADDPETLEHVSAAADKACGYAFGALERNNHGVFATAAGAAGWEYDRVAAVQDRYSAQALACDDPTAPLGQLYAEGLGVGGADADDGDDDAGT